MIDYDQIYRELHPRQFPHSPYEKQRELRNLWPSEQEKFKQEIDVVLRAALEQSKEK